MFSAQHPLPSGFGPQSTTGDVINGRDLTGTVAIVTGGYSGLGLETARTLATAGAQVIVPARDATKAEASLAGIPGIELEVLDLADPRSIDDFADRFLASDRPLDLLINNAGVMAVPFALDDRGFESHIATNHLGHFQLTSRLWPALKRSSAARVVSLVSGAYRFSNVDFDDPNYSAREYEKWGAYAQSMTAKTLFTVALDARGRDHGVRAFAVHPGVIKETSLNRHLSQEELDGMGDAAAISAPLKSVAQGAATTVWAATSPQLDALGGLYLHDSEVAFIVDSGGDPFAPGVDAWVINPAAAERLWTLSEQLIGRSFQV